MHFSTSAASRLIAMLESEIKLRLFNRTRRSLTLTPQGEAFYREAEHILAGFDEIPRIASDMRSRPQGQSRLVTGPRLAAQRSVTAHDLREEPLLGLWPGQRWGQQVDGFFEAGGVRPRYAVETRSPLMSRQLAQLGAGVAILDRVCAQALDPRGAVMRPLEPERWVLFGCVYQARQPLGPAALALLDCMRRVLEQFRSGAETTPIRSCWPRRRAKTRSGACRRPPAAPRP